MKSYLNAILFFFVFLFSIPESKATIIFNILDLNGAPICNGDSIQILTSGYFAAATEWYTPDGFYYTSTDLIINNGQPSNSGWYRFKIYGAGNFFLEEDSILINFPPPLICNADTTIQAPTGNCGAIYNYSIPINPCSGFPMLLQSGFASGSEFPAGTTHVSYTSALTQNYFIEPFNDNSAGWTLGTQWQIGPTTNSFCASSSTGNDPFFDHSDDFNNGVAGVVIGGCASTAIHPFYYLTSPVIDLSTSSSIVMLEFYRHLHSDYPPYMNNSVEVFDGSAWITIWSGPTSSTTINDIDWLLQSFDISAYRNANFRVRFGFLVGASGAFNAGSWSLDDVRIYTPSNPLSCSFDVTVLSGDTTPPVINCAGLSIYDAPIGSCGFDKSQLIIPTAIDNCSDVTISNDAPAILPVGTSYVTFTAIDENGNSSSCSDNIVVRDLELPQITCNGPLTFYTSQCNPFPNPGLVPPTLTTDNCGIYSVTSDAPTFFNPGNTLVTWTVNDYSLNANSCTQIITVVDTSNVPTIVNCINDTTIYANGYFCGAYYYYDTPTEIINCVPVDLQFMSGLPSGSIFPFGSTTITYSSQLTIFDDDFNDNNAGWTIGTNWQIGPTSISSCASCPGNDPEFDHSSSFDNGVAGVVLGGCLNLPNTIAPQFITSPIIDLSLVPGPISLEFWRHLHSDYMPYMDNYVQVFDGSSWQTIFSTFGSNICFNDTSWTNMTFDITAYKNSLFRIRFGYDVSASGAYSSGSWNIDDVRILRTGNSVCTFNVNVVDADTIAPQIYCSGEYNFSTDPGLCTSSTVVLPTPYVYEPCNLYSLTNDAPAIFNKGITPVTWTAIDDNGNTSTCIVQVYVTDLEPPTINCGATDTVYALPGQCNVNGYTPTLPVVTDNCGGFLNIFNNSNPNGVFNNGINSYYWEVIDASGNYNACEKFVYVVGDTLAPPVVLNCSPDTVIQISNNNSCGAYFNFPTPTVLRNCIETPMMQIAGVSSGNFFNGGTTTNEFMDVSNVQQIFSEDFNDNSAGWSLDPMWEIAPTSYSLCYNSCFGLEPNSDHSLGNDNSIAGIGMGNCITVPITQNYITSPVLDLSPYNGIIMLDVWKMLHSNDLPDMEHTIDVYDGNNWITIFSSAANGCNADYDWAKMQFNISGYASSDFKLRFGAEIQSVSGNSVASWNLDDISIYNIDTSVTLTCSFTVTVDTNNVWYHDVDGDGYGNLNDSVVSCAAPFSYTDNSTDCDDNNNSIYPGAFEICGNGIDENCDGSDLPCTSTVIVRCIIQGFYIGSYTMTPALFNTGVSIFSDEVDSVLIQLVDPLDLNNVVESHMGILNTNGYVYTNFNIANQYGSYYIVVIHRNSIQTWSKNPVILEPVTFYDFTSYGAASRKRQ